MVQCKFYFLLPSKAFQAEAGKEEAESPSVKRVVEENPSSQSPKRVETSDENKKE